MIHKNFQQMQADERRKGEKQILTLLSTDSKSCSRKTKRKEGNKQPQNLDSLQRERIQLSAIMPSEKTPA
jgi:hypothetical protein